MKKLIFIILTTPIYINAQVSVGWDAACTYNLNTDVNGLQQAIDDGATEIRLSYENVHHTSVEINENLVLKGGYSDCASANNGSQSNINSIIDATDEGQPAVKIRSINDAQVTLDTLTIQNGTGVNDGSTSNWAGGLSIDQTSGAVTLNRINLTSNTGINGGGLSIVNFNSSGSLLLVVNDMTIQGNRSSSKGGGLYCYASESSFDSQLVLDAATVRNNHTDGNGGGLYVDGCELGFNAGISTFVNNNIDKEIYQNTANTSAGGVFATGGAVINLSGNNTNAFDVVLNEANLDTNVSGSGGGVFATSSGTVVNLENTFVGNNSTGRYGAGLFASFDGSINMKRSAGGCSYSDFCSQITSNFNSGLLPGGGGAMAARFNGILNIKQTLIRWNNSEDNGYVLYSSPDGQALLEGNLVIENGDDGNVSNHTAIFQTGDAAATFAYNTIQNNRSTSTLFQQGSNTSVMNIFGNIIKEFGNIHQDSSSFNNINCNLINDDSTIEVVTSNTFLGAVDFIDSDNSDFRLAETDTIAIDICDIGIYTPNADLQGKERGVDHPDVVNEMGAFDLGAYEYDDSDLIYKDSFELIN